MLKKIGFALLVGFGIPGIAVAGVNTVPEPETLALLAIGAAAIAIAAGARSDGSRHPALTIHSSSIRHVHPAHRCHAAPLAFCGLAIAGTPNAVPEPETLALLAIGVAAIAIARWRKK